MQNGESTDACVLYELRSGDAEEDVAGSYWLRGAHHRFVRYSGNDRNAINDERTQSGPGQFITNCDTATKINTRVAVEIHEQPRRNGAKEILCPSNLKQYR